MEHLKVYGASELGRSRTLAETLVRYSSNHATELTICVTLYSRLFNNGPVTFSHSGLFRVGQLMLLAALKALTSNVADKKAIDLKTAFFTQ